MIGKIDIRQLVADHFLTLVDDDTKKQSGFDFILFYLLPLCIAAGFVYFQLILGKSMGNVLITALERYLLPYYSTSWF